MQTRLSQKTNEMGHRRVIPLLIRYSIPTTIGYAAFSIYNLVDRAFIGRAMGGDALAGITITFPIFMICIAIGMMIGIGGGTMASLRLGEGNAREAERILGNVVALYFICGLTLSVAGELLLNPLLEIFGASAATLPHARTYMGILLLFLVADFMAMGMNGMLRAEGNPNISMTYLLLGAGANVILDYLFIFHFHWGVAGAAIATGISKLLSASCILWHFTRGHRRALTLRRTNLRLNPATVLSIFHIGLSPFTMQFIQSAVIIVMNRVLLRQGGDMAVASMGIVYAVILLLIIPTMGLIHGSQPIIGFNYGARNYRRVRQALLTALSYAFGVTLVGLLLVLAHADDLIAIFARNDPALADSARQGLRIALLMMPLAASQMIGAHYFQATGRPTLSITLHIFRQVFCLLAGLAILPRIWGLTGAWAVMPVADFISTLLTAVFIIREWRYLSRSLDSPA